MQAVIENAKNNAMSAHLKTQYAIVKIIFICRCLYFLIFQPIKRAFCFFNGLCSFATFLKFLESYTLHNRGNNFQKMVFKTKVIS